MSAELTELSGLELAELIAARTVSPVDVVRAVYTRLDATEPGWNCFVLRTADRALAEAETAEREIAAGDYRGPLHGLPDIPQVVHGVILNRHRLRARSTHE